MGDPPKRVELIAVLVGGKLSEAVDEKCLDDNFGLGLIRRRTDSSVSAVGRLRLRLELSLASQAIELLDGKEFKGRPLKINEARPREPHTGGGTDAVYSRFELLIC